MQLSIAAKTRINSRYAFVLEKLESLLKVDDGSEPPARMKYNSSPYAKVPVRL